MINRKQIAAMMVLAGIAGAARPATAQSTLFNRSIAGLSALPAEASGMHDIRVFVSVEAAATSIPLDLSTEVLVMVNGTVVDILSVAFDADPGCGLNCLANQACICCEISPGESICSCGWLTAELPSQANLQPEDEIMVLLRPVPGAMPEEDDTDDAMQLTYHGEPIYWDRGIAAVDLSPTPGAPAGIFDIAVEVEVESNYDGTLPLAAELQLQVNGIAVANASVPELDVALGWNQCSGQPCDDTVACVIDPAGPYYGSCQEDDDGPLSCSCQYHPVPSVTPSFLAIPLLPGDELTVILMPVPGALPELPGFGDDDRVEVTRTCPADLNGDGLVDAADLASLLGAWGPNAGHPADLNSDGMVDAADLAQLLGNWGPCFPV